MPKSSLRESMCISGLQIPQVGSMRESSLGFLTSPSSPKVLVLPEIDLKRLIHLDLQFLGNKVDF
jgi:hypothetical protein